jgi:hypothetical protein
MTLTDLVTPLLGLTAIIAIGALAIVGIARALEEWTAWKEKTK